MVSTMAWGIPEQGWRKGPWTPEEDKLLTEYVNLNGEGRWSSVARCAGLNRRGKSCRLRWVNYLRPGLKRGQITPQEEGIIIELHALWGNKWSTIARYLPGRTDNEIKNFWRTHFKKKEKSSKKQQKRRSQSLIQKFVLETTKDINGHEDHQPQVPQQENNIIITKTPSAPHVVPDQQHYEANIEADHDQTTTFDHDHQAREIKHENMVLTKPIMISSGDQNSAISTVNVPSDQFNSLLPGMFQDHAVPPYSWSDIISSTNNIADQEYLWGGLWNPHDNYNPLYGHTINNINNNQVITAGNYSYGGDSHSNKIIPIQNQARAFSSYGAGCIF